MDCVRQPALSYLVSAFTHKLHRSAACHSVVGSAIDRPCFPTASAVGFHTAQPSQHWVTILNIFNQLLSDLQGAKVPPFLVRKLFQQLFSCVNVNLFNQLLLRRECCSFSNGEHVKSGLGEVEQWIHRAGENWVGDSWEQLKYIRQARLLSLLL